MLQLSKNDGTLIALFEDYQTLYQHIMHEENFKLFQYHPQFPKFPWSFIVFSPEGVAELIQTLQKKHDMELLYESWSRELPMLEICKGNYQDIELIPLTPEIDVEAMREDWCKAYCQSQEISVTEIEDNGAA